MAWINVLMPIYNGQTYLREALDSLLAQSLRDWELLAIDDGSTDATAAILAEYAGRDDRVRVVRQERRGLVETLNHGLELAQGSYLARLDADDRAAPERLARQAACLEANPRLALCGSAYRVIDERGAGQRVDTPPLDDTTLRWELLFHCPFAHPSVMLRLDVLRQAGLRYDPQALHVEDYALWSRLLELGEGCNLAEPLIDYRVHEGQVSQLQAARQWENANRVAQANWSRLGIALSLEQVGRLRQWYGRFPAYLGSDDAQLVDALWQALQAFSRQPGLDASSLRRIRGRWLARLLLTPGRRLGRVRWLPQLQLADGAALATYLLAKFRARSS
jgi:hypothetical protein